MPINTYDQLINRIANGFAANYPIWDELQTGTVPFGLNQTGIIRLGWPAAMPNPLVTGVTAYIPTRINYLSNAGASTATQPGSILFAKVVNLGTLNLSTNSFAVSGTMPTVTELGVSRQVAGPVFAVFTTAAGVSSGNVSIAYTNQSGVAKTSPLNPLPLPAAQGFASTPTHTAGAIVLAAGDTGATAITNAVRSGGTTPTGVLTFYGIYPISMTYPNAYTQRIECVVTNLITEDFAPMRLGAGDQLACFACYQNQSQFINPTTASGHIYVVGDN